VSAFLEYFLGAIGGAVVALGVVASLFNRFMDIQVSRAIESHKAELTERTEALKTELSIYAHEQTVGLSRIDAQRSESIRTIWKTLVEWHETFLKITVTCTPWTIPPGS
jgi:hypothetical protein